MTDETTRPKMGDEELAEILAVERGSIRETDKCTCGHLRSDHVFGSGTCNKNCYGVHDHDCGKFKQDPEDKILSAMSRVRASRTPPHEP